MMRTLATMDVDASASFGYSNKKVLFLLMVIVLAMQLLAKRMRLPSDKTQNASGRGGISLGNDTLSRLECLCRWLECKGDWERCCCIRASLQLTVKVQLLLVQIHLLLLIVLLAIGNGANASKSDAIAVGTSRALLKVILIALGKNTQAKTQPAAYCCW